MRNIHLLLFFIFSTVVISFDIGFYSIFILEIIFMGISIREFFVGLKRSFPFGQLFSLLFFISYSFSMSILYILSNYKLSIGYERISMIPILDYLPFAFLSSQAFLIGFNSIKPSFTPWSSFLLKFDLFIPDYKKYILLILPCIGYVLKMSGISSLDYIAYLFINTLTCTIIAFSLLGYNINIKYLILGIILNFIILIQSSMIGDFVYFLLLATLIILKRLILINKRINWLLITVLFVAGIWGLALLQIVKTDYRSNIWLGNKQADASLFYQSVNSNLNTDLNNYNLYIPVLIRLNQGMLASAVVEKVPLQKDFEAGATLIKSIVDSFLPRFLNPEKEKAGGREKIEKYTNIELVGSTSMNIGILGEAYLNFGKQGSIIFMVIYGYFMAFIEKKYYESIKTQPMYFYFYPLYFFALLGNGADLLMVFNSIVKITIFTFIITQFFKRI